MTFSIFHGVAAGAVITGAIVAFVVHPAALSPHASPTPSLDVRAGDDADARPAAARATAQRATVYVAGAVVHPGVYALASDARALDAVTKAGGFAHDADTVAVNLAAHVTDGDEIAVPRIGDPAPDATASAHHRAGRRSTKHSHRGRHRRAPRRDAGDETAANDALPQPIDLNTADAATLATIPGVGETLAERIVEFREVNGPYPTVDALADVSGITASRFDAIASYLTVRP
jgi:competence protein ComEA